MQSRLEDLLSRVEELTGRFRERMQGLRGRRPNFDGVRDRLHDRSRGLPRSGAASSHDVKERLRESDGWIVAARERVRPWHAVPALLSAARPDRRRLLAGRRGGRPCERGSAHPHRQDARAR